MKKLNLILLGLFSSFVTLAQTAHLFAEDQLIIHFKSEMSVNPEISIPNQRFELNALDELNEKEEIQSIELTGNKRLADTYLLHFKNKKDILELVDVYFKTGLFEYVEPNFIGQGGGRQGFFQSFPDDTYFNHQYGLYNDGSFTNSPAVDDADIDMEMAWDIEQGDSSIIVAILDSGTKLDHPEFDGRIWTNANESPDGTDSDNNGFIDDNIGWDFAYNDNLPADDYGHGTNVTGIIGANGNNTLGYAGVDWNCKLMICKILDIDNYGLYSWWANAIYYAVDNGADVINMSVGGSGFSNTLKAAIDYAYDNGVTVVACMMNYNNNVTYYPAGFLNTIAVGSTDANDQRSAPFFWDPASGSNYGLHIDVVAPGNYIYGLRYNSDTNYNSYWGGTSQATPLVSGLSALLLAQNNSRTPDDIREIIQNTAEDQIGAVSEDVMGFDPYYGYGRLNAYNALNYSTTGLGSSLENKITLRVYPNPTSAELMIERNKVFDQLSIIDQTGRIVYRASLTSEESMHSLNVSGIRKGFYFVQFSDSKTKKSISKKVRIN